MRANGLLVAASLGSLVSAANHKVAVGSGGDIFSPASLTAVAGDTVEFDFTGSRHDVVQSTFDSPCSPSSNGFYVQPQTGSGVTFTITVNDTNPIYFYCSVPNHCKSGMVGIINPASGKSQGDFATAARSATLSAPGGSAAAFGGVLGSGSSSGSSTSGGSSTATSSGSASSGTGSAASDTSTSKAGAAIATAIPAAFAVVAGAVAAYL